MSDIDHPKRNPHKLQKIANELLERGAIAMSVKLNEEIHLSNGCTVIFKKFKNSQSVTLIIIAPRDVRVYRLPGVDKSNGETH